MLEMLKEEIADFIRFWREQFLATHDRESFVWLFCLESPPEFVCSPLPPSALHSSVYFGNAAFGIHIINQFAGPQPILLSYEALTKEIQIMFRPTVIMDSNVVSYVHQYVVQSPILDIQRRAVVHAFIRFVVSKGLDYNPFFYYLESAAKDESGTLLPHAVAASRSILTLHTMDKERFLASGDIVTDPAKLEAYANAYGATTIGEIAPHHARSMVHSDPQLEAIARSIYATLLKIGLIHKSNRGSVASKYGELLFFMQQTLGVGLAPERILSIGYFAGQYDGFIPIQIGANPERLFKRLRAAAWDLLLLRLPAQLPCERIEGQVALGYVATSDNALKQAAEACTVEGVMALTPRIHAPLPLFSPDISKLEQLVEAKTISEIKELNHRWNGVRMLTGVIHPLSHGELMGVIAELEAEAVRFCVGG